MTKAILGLLVLRSATIVAAEPAATVLTVSQLECKGCPKRLEKQLAKTHGVLTARVQAAENRAAITHDPGAPDAGEIAESLQRAGFGATLPPWEPASASFNECSSGLCGYRRPNAIVHAHPGASIGDEVYCPINGVVLKVTAATPKDESEGTPVYVCCEGCLRCLRANRARVHALRGTGAVR